MNNKITKFSSLACLSLFLLASCGGGGGGGSDTSTGVGTVDGNTPADANVSAGDLDLSRYVALGDSLTAGFSDGSLFRDGQTNSLPNILANLFARAGGGSFDQPIVADNLGGLVDLVTPARNQPTRLVLTINNGNFSPIRQSGTPTTDVADVQVGPFNNLGVPGATSFQLPFAGFGSSAGNPFFERFASSPATSVVADAVAQTPTFFSLWIGNNDILGYATSGGVGTVGGTTPPFASTDITNPAVFAGSFSGIVNALTANGTNDVRGVLVNIPAVADIPFFTTVPFNAIPLDSASAAAANAAFAGYNAALQAAAAGVAPFPSAVITADEATRRTINFVEGQNAVLILDEMLTDLTSASPALLNFRQATADDAILLTSSSLLGTLRTPGDPTTVIGVGSPLLDAEVLTEDEIALIESARTSYNATISGLASGSANLALYDAAADLTELRTTGILVGDNPVPLTSSFISGGAFSLDGVHPTATGYAVLANGIIDVLNAEFNATLPKTNPDNFPRTFFEFPAGTDFTQ